MIETICPHCGNKKTFSDVYAGRTFRCPNCKEPVKIQNISEIIQSEEDSHEPPLEDQFKEYEKNTLAEKEQRIREKKSELRLLSIGIFILLCLFVVPFIYGCIGAIDEGEVGLLLGAILVFGLPSVLLVLRILSINRVIYELEKLDVKDPNFETSFASISTQHLKKTKSESSETGCYVATSIYGSYDCPEVWTLRRFRDQVLDETWYGRLFIRIYYAISPKLVSWFGETRWFRVFWRKRLDSFVRNLQAKGFESTQYEDKTY